MTSTSSTTVVGRWDEAPLGDLIDHLVTAYHRPLVRALATLPRHARGAVGPDFAGRVEELRELLVEHMRREEELVFPWLRRPRPGGAELLVHLLEHEHGDTLRRVRVLRAEVAARARVAPRAARALSARLRRLERGLDAHILLENRVLFPRALAAAPWAG